MRYDNTTFMDMLYKMIDIAENGGSAVFDDADQESKVTTMLKVIETLMQN